MTTRLFRERLMNADRKFVKDELVAKFDDSYFFFLSVLLGAEAETPEADELFVDRVNHEKKTGEYWKNHRKERKLVLAQEVAVKLQEVGYADIPAVTTIAYRISRALSQVERFTSRNEIEASWTHDMSLRQMAQAARLKAQNPNAKFRVNSDGTLRIVEE